MIKYLFAIILTLLLIDTVIAQPSPGDRMSIVAASTGGAQAWQNLSITDAISSVKIGEGQVYGILAWNNSSCRRFLKIFGGEASEITLGTTPPATTIMLVPNQPPTFIPMPVGVEFPTGISVACTKYPEVTSTAGAGANECVGNVYYK